jgi:hypothetical protein
LILLGNKENKSGSSRNREERKKSIHENEYHLKVITLEKKNKNNVAPNTV